MNHFKISITILSLLLSLVVQAQSTRGCKSHEASMALAQKDSNYANSVHRQSEVVSMPNARMNTSLPYVIPVVIHVLYNTPTQNISDAQIASQITALNKDYSKTNDNFSAATPSAFQALAGATSIQFVLAKRDPNGSPTTGIIRKSTNVVAFNDNDDMKYSAKGGIEGWDPTQYLNIWVCKLVGSTLGYAYYPGASADIDGAVISYECFGTIGTVSPPFHLGRTVTHEIGHYLNLKHIWGDASTQCTGTDFVDDTPQHHAANTGCHTYPYKVCPATGDDGEMYMNYMDYSDDDCMSMFSQGQVNRMMTALTNSRASLLSSKGGLPFDHHNDVVITKLLNPSNSGETCGDIIPQIEITNIGIDTLKSVNISTTVNKQFISTIQWTGLLPPLEKKTINLSLLSLNKGQNSLVFYTDSPNHGTDEDLSNDTLKQSIINIGTTTLPLLESFEGNTFPPTGWAISNPDNNTTWEQTSSSAYVGSKSMVFKNYNTTGFNGQQDLFISPKFNTKDNSSLSFYYAYKVYSNPFIASDTLTISASIDCGQTKKVIYKKGGEDLVVTTPKYTTNFYTPSSKVEWKKESISLLDFSNQDVVLYFENKTENENNLYIDSIFIDSSTITDLAAGAINKPISVYPNPTEGLVTVFTNGGFDLVACYNLMGAAVGEISATTNETATIDLRALPKGIYLVNVKKGDGQFWHKVAKN
jgi:hypothetical protein